MGERCGTARGGALATAIALLAVTSAQAGELGPRLRTELERPGLPTTVRVIVHLGAAPARGELDRLAAVAPRAAFARELRRLVRAREAPLRAVLAAWGIQGVTSLPTAGAIALELPTALVTPLAARVEVARIDLDAALAAPAPATAPVTTNAWNLDAVGAPTLWGEGLRGAGVVVASLDTGVDALHADLVTRWRAGMGGWFDPNGEHPTPYDASGHGTQVMGLVVGGDAGGAPLGVAPDAQWIAAKIYDDSGTALLSRIHAAFAWLMDPDGDPQTDDAPQVVNASWGFVDAVGQCITEFDADIGLLRALGIAVVFSAGNAGPAATTDLSPANGGNVLATGAVDASLAPASFSSRGPSACSGAIFPDLVAPGVAVRTADLTAGGVVPLSYVAATGTSFAAPHVAGVLVLLRSAFPAASLATLEDALRTSARDLGPTGPDDTVGFGLVDAPRALAALRGLTCHDSDGDGAFAESCAGPPDCDDHDARRYPGAPERVGDGIDQDCNGVDLTIRIISAEARPDGRATVVATSAAGEPAALEVVGIGPMHWDAVAGAFELTVPADRLGAGPITVRGAEGAVTKALALVVRPPWQSRPPK